MSAVLDFTETMAAAEPMKVFIPEYEFNQDDVYLYNVATKQLIRHYTINSYEVFCARCGGNLFWKTDGASHVYITAGTLDKPTALKVAEHIFVASKSDYYEITDGLPQKDEW